ncbi:hypothetical protein QE152_g29589 [Popillia japonica]|uniref:Uncharacterized protein n=1 Tax=Popillia japonica TaxID=7064 RepID=A0AAW1JH60_POPJA
MKLNWLNVEIGFLYSKLNKLETIAYQQHMKLAYTTNRTEWDLHFIKMNQFIATKTYEKRQRLKNKLNNLKHANNTTPPQPKPNILNEPRIVNKSTVEFSEAETRLLQRGLKHGIYQENLPMEDIMNDIHIASTKLNPENQSSNIMSPPF